MLRLRVARVTGRAGAAARLSRWLPGIALVLAIGVFALVANAGQPPVLLGTADSFAVLAGQGVTNTGPTLVSGDLGTHPNPAVTGFPPGIVVNGTIHAADAVAQQAQNDLTTAYNDAASRTPVTTLATELGGQTLLPGVYTSQAGTFQITGTLTLNAAGDPNGVFIFKMGSTLITASSSNVSLVGGAQACNVFWQVGSSATLGTTSTFRGNILALQSITVNTGVTVDGRVLARNGAVTLDNDTITRARCSVPPPTSPPPTSPPPTSPPPTSPPPTSPPPTSPPPTSPPPTTPPPTTPPPTTPPPTTPPGAPGAGGPGAGGPGAGGLPATGLAVAGLLALSLVLLSAGGWLVYGERPVYFGRRRTGGVGGRHRPPSRAPRSP